MIDYATLKKALKGTEMPCALLLVDSFQQNVKQIAANSKQKHIRVASKSIRSISVLKDIFQSSSTFRGIMSYSGSEAIYLADHGFDDLLIAYPIWNETILHNIAERVKSGKTLTVMIDSVAHIDRLEAIAKKAKSTFLVCIDIDLSSSYPGLHFGVHRSPIKTVEHAIAIVNRINDSRYLQLDGVMGYEAQIAGVTDNDPKQKMKNQAIRFLKKTSSKELTKKRHNVIAAIKSKGIPLRFVNGGGTGSLHQTALDEHVTEVTVGSGFYNPHLFDYYQAFQLKPALVYAIEITRIPARHIYTCSGGGYIASGAMGYDRLPKVFLPEGAHLTTHEGAGEVQTPIVYKGDIPLEHGDPIILRHSKAGELCEHFQYLHLVKNGRIVRRYTTYRGDQQCFL
ncbi:MAG TPA: amino acid deaminase/aldolase [Bacillota bacterium]|nr:amino acid deaminase/aldolase [Bacillota bacterium]